MFLGIARSFISLVMAVLLLSSLPALSQEQPSDLPQLQALATTGDVVDAAKQIAETSGFALPPGALDGAKSTDLMYQTLKMIFGQPIANISRYTTNADPGGNTEAVRDVNVIVYLFSMMAGIGLIATLVSSIWTIMQSLVSINTSAKLFSNNNGQGSPFAFLVSRMGAASILNAPIPAAGGMSLSQVIMLFMALLGIGLGSQLFYFVASRMIDQPLITYTSQRNEVFFINVAQAQLCLDFLEQNEFIKPEHNTFRPQEYRRADGRVNTYITFGNRNQCGTIAFDLLSAPSSPSTETGGALASFLYNGSGDNVERAIEDFFRPQSIKSVENLLNNPQFRAAIKGIMQSQFSADGYTPPPQVVSDFAASYATYKADVNSIFYQLDEKVNKCENRPARGRDASNSSLACSNEIIRDSIAKYGFMLAGTYTYILNERQSVISNAIEALAPKFNFESDTFKSRYSISETSSYNQEYENRSNMLFATFEHIRSTTTDTLQEDLNQLYEATTGDGMMLEALGDALYGSIRAIVKVGYLGQNSSFQNPEPITQMAQIGNVMMGLPIAMAGLSWLSKAKNLTPAGLIMKAKEFGGKLKPEKNSIMGTVMAMMLAALMQAIVVGGFFLAVFIPAIPYVMWNMAIFGYIGYVLLVVVGVPIMVAAKPLNDGEGFIGGVKTGYMMAFTIFIRPAAMVIGLVVAMVLSRIFSWVINATYFESMQIAHSNGFSVAGVFGIPLMYAIIQLTAIYKAYSMINEVPAFIGKMTETDRAHSDFGEEGERTRVGGVFVQSGQSAMGGLQKARTDKPMSGGGGGMTPKPA